MQNNFYDRVYMSVPAHYHWSMLSRSPRLLLSRPLSQSLIKTYKMMMMKKYDDTFLRRYRVRVCVCVCVFKSHIFLELTTGLCVCVWRSLAQNFLFYDFSSLFRSLSVCVLSSVTLSRSLSFSLSLIYGRHITAFDAFISFPQQKLLFSLPPTEMCEYVYSLSLSRAFFYLFPCTERVYSLSLSFIITMMLPTYFSSLVYERKYFLFVLLSDTKVLLLFLHATRVE
jgi:hypothetical protein